MCPAPELQWHTDSHTAASREQEMFRYLRTQVTLHYVEQHAFSTDGTLAIPLFASLESVKIQTQKPGDVELARMRAGMLR